MILLVATVGVTATAHADELKRVLAFGDSLTWGAQPTKQGKLKRLPAAERWPIAMQTALGKGYFVTEEGLNGRTIDIPNAPAQQPSLDGSEALPGILARGQPFDVVVIMLGSNDVNPQYDRTPARIAEGMGKLVRMVRDMHGGISTLGESPKVLVVAPPPLAENPWSTADDKSRELASAYAAIAKEQHVEFFDAGTVIQTDGVDGVHLSGATQQKLGRALAEKVRAMAQLKDPHAAGLAHQPR
jgi:lysophospholipase L1-like esterase